MRILVHTALVAALATAGCGGTDPTPPGDEVDASVVPSDAALAVCGPLVWTQTKKLGCVKFTAGVQDTPAGDCTPTLDVGEMAPGVIGCIVGCPDQSIAGPGAGVEMEADEASKTLTFTVGTWGFRCQQ